MEVGLFRGCILDFITESQPERREPRYFGKFGKNGQYDQWAISPKRFRPLNPREGQVLMFGEHFCRMKQPASPLAGSTHPVIPAKPAVQNIFELPLVQEKHSKQGQSSLDCCLRRKDTSYHLISIYPHISSILIYPPFGSCYKARKPRAGLIAGIRVVLAGEFGGPDRKGVFGNLEKIHKIDNLPSLLRVPFRIGYN